jgi:hypothetical protein
MQLDFEQRQEAERLIEQAQDEDVLREFLYELICLRSLLRPTAAMANAVNCLDGWSGFSADDLRLLVGAMRGASVR